MPRFKRYERESIAGPLRWHETVKILREAGMLVPRRPDGKVVYGTDAVSQMQLKRTRYAIYVTMPDGSRQRVEAKEIELELEKIQCLGCMQWLEPEENFYVGDYPTGRVPQCKKCQSAYMKERHRQQRKQVRQKDSVL